MLKVVFFCHSVLSDSPVLHAEPDLFYRINLVSFQLAMNRVTGRAFWIRRRAGSFNFSASASFLYLFYAVFERQGLLPNFLDCFGTWNEMMLLRHCKWSLTVALLIQTGGFTMRLYHPRHNIIYNDVDEIKSNQNPAHTARLRLLREYNLR